MLFDIKKLLSIIVSLLTVTLFSCGTFDHNHTTIPQNEANELSVISSDVIQDWHQFKDKLGATLSGSQSWKQYLSFVESKLKQFGVIDIEKNTWRYPHWSTSRGHNNDNWNLVADGVSYKVAHYGAYSGGTTKDGTVAELVNYDADAPPSFFKNKIVVFKTSPHPEKPLNKQYKKWFTYNDYEYLSDQNTFQTLFTKVPASSTVSFDTWWQLRQTVTFNKILRQTQAAGGVIVFNMSYQRLSGLYTFPVPELMNVPVLYVDRDVGRNLQTSAAHHKTATIKLIAKIVLLETYQLIGYLPGKHYGEKNDEILLLISHSDGPSISQENGALGLLSVLHHFSLLPQDNRNRTLMFFLDNRHYMPGTETAWVKQDWFSKYPDIKKSIVGLISMEHLGQMEYKELDNMYAPTKRVEPSFLWTRNDPQLITMAINAVKENHWPRVMVQAPEKPGIHGTTQGIWYGMGKIAVEWNIPAFATMGMQGAYWSTTGDINKFNPELFQVQVRAMTQLTGKLMGMELR